MITISMWTLFVFCLILVVNFFVLLSSTNAVGYFFSDTLLKSYPDVVFPIKVLIATIFFISTKLLILFSHAALTIMYASVSYFCSQLIKECGNHLQSESVHGQCVANFMRSYGRVHTFVLRIEESLSFQILFLSASNFFELFSLFSRILGFTPVRQIYQVGNFVSSFLSSLSFLVIAVFASRVDTQDGVLRRVSKMAAFNLSLSKNTQPCGELLTRFMESRERLTLTAFGLFQFTRSFLLGSSGVLLTYNLLIVQIDSPW